MPTDCISYQDSGYFIPLMNDYLNQKPELSGLYHRFPTLENFGEQLREKQANFPAAHRATLVSVLQEQYVNVRASEATKTNIAALADTNTFTVTTGHQLNLFTGPMYFLYKIITAINLAKMLKAQYPAQQFVPVYWMATEDHDFEEINHFYLRGKKIRWNAESSGPVGRLSTDGLAEVYDVFEKEIGQSTNALFLKDLFKRAYLEHKTLAQATRYIANELFAEKGLVILDADDAQLKRAFVPYIKEELLQQTAHREVLATIEKLKGYDIQVNPREINLFYIEDKLRERIVQENGKYHVKGTTMAFTTEEIMDTLEKHPEKFSPNVMMRPLYQEVILPNLCYIGGGGELAYWLELKSYFDKVKVSFPILLLRNSALITTKKQAEKADKLGLNWKDLFSKAQDLVNSKTKELSDFPIDLSIQKDHLKTQFHYLFTLAHKTDASFSGAVKAQEAKQIRGLEHLEKRLLKAQKRKYEQELSRITELQQTLFPSGGLQERKANFSEFYVEFGKEMIAQMIREFDALGNEFNVLIL